MTLNKLNKVIFILRFQDLISSLFSVIFEKMNDFKILQKQEIVFILSKMKPVKIRLGVMTKHYALD